MGCPDSIRKALEELDGIEQVVFDMRTRAFSIAGPVAANRQAVEAALNSAGAFTIADWFSKENSR